MELALVGDPGVPALHYDLASVARRVGEFSPPVPRLGGLNFSFLIGNVGTGLEQLVADASDRFVGGIAVQFLCTPAPVRDAIADLPRKNCVL
jgi:hypothetical protein